MLGLQLGSDESAGLPELLAKMETRCVVHVDMDCFYCEVERQRNPSLRGKPMAVLQYNPRDPRTLLADDDRIVNDSDGSIIAVSYEARAQGVTRIMRGRDARAACPSLICVQVPVTHSKADISIYRNAGAAVLCVLQRYGTTARASIDEAYVDISEAAAALARRVAEGVEPLIPPPPAGGLERGHFGPDHPIWTWVAGVDEAGDARPLSKAEVRNGHAHAHAHGAATPAVVAPAEAGVAAVEGGAGAVEAARLQFMAELRARAARQQSESQGLQARAEADGAVAACARWWQRPAAEWSAPELLLACGARIVAAMRAAVASDVGYSCSAGLAHSMTLSKLGSSMHKPGAQTVLPSAAMAGALHALPIERIKGLGGKDGRAIQAALGITTVGELAAVPLQTLVSKFDAKLAGKATRGSGVWLFRIARGIELTPVKDEPLQQSHGASKNFLRSKTGSLTSVAQLRFWLAQLAAQVLAQLADEEAEHGRVATRLTVQWGDEDSASSYSAGRSRSCRLARPYSAERMIGDAVALIERERAERAAPLRVATLGLNASGLERIADRASGSSTLASMWAHATSAAAADGSTAPPDELPPADPSAREAAAASPARPAAAQATPPRAAAPPRPRDVGPVAAAPPRTPPLAERPAPSKYARLSAADLDPATLAELPADVRAELLAELAAAPGRAAPSAASGSGRAGDQRSSKRPRGGGGGGAAGIASYFKVQT